MTTKKRRTMYIKFRNANPTMNREMAREAFLAYLEELSGPVKG